MSAITAKASRKMKKYAVLTREPRCFLGSFDFSWEQRKLGDVVQITMGQSPDGSTYSDEPSDYILVQGNADLQNGWVCPRIWTTQITKKADAGDLIMSVRAPAGAMGKTAYNAVIGRGVAAIKGNEFIYQLLVKMDADGFWKTLSCGSTFESLNSDNIKNAEVKIPTTAEQIKIGGYFQQLDNLITLHQRKCVFLFGFFQAFISMIFTASTFSWEQRKLEDYLTVSAEKNTGNIYGRSDVLSVSGDYGIVNQIEFQGRSFAGASVSNYGVVQTGDVVYTKSPLNSNPYGIIKTNKGKPGIVSTLYAVYHPKENAFSDFIQVYFEQHARMNNYMHPLVNKGAKNDMKVSAENALKGPVCFPSRIEQESISAFFSVLDNLITLHQRKPFLMKWRTSDANRNKTNRLVL
mgnify:CR=1 FL=1